MEQLRWNSGCFYERDREAGRIKISQQTYVEELAEQYGVSYHGGIPLRAARKLWDFDPEEPDVYHPFRDNQIVARRREKQERAGSSAREVSERDVSLARFW